MLDSLRHDAILELRLAHPPVNAFDVALSRTLLMQVLAALGLRVSEEMIEARRDNPRGFYEDAPIVRIQADLLRARSNGRRSVAVSVPAGRRITFRYRTASGQWFDDDGADGYEANPHGSRNAVVFT